MNNHSISCKSKMVVREIEQAILEHSLNKHQIGAKTPKRMRFCLRCRATLIKKHKCASCGLRFHDGPLLSWLKKLWGVSPR